MRFRVHMKVHIVFTSWLDFFQIACGIDYSEKVHMFFLSSGIQERIGDPQDQRGRTVQQV